jgi:hypothetical protein
VNGSTEIKYTLIITYNTNIYTILCELTTMYFLNFEISELHSKRVKCFSTYSTVASGCSLKRSKTSPEMKSPVVVTTKKKSKDTFSDLDDFIDVSEEFNTAGFMSNFSELKKVEGLRPSEILQLSRVPVGLVEWFDSNLGAKLKSFKLPRSERE